MSRSPLYLSSRIIFAAAGLLIAVLTSTSFAQSPVQQRNTCTGRDNNASAAAKLSACVAIIESAREPSSVLAIAHTVRGDAFRTKNEPDRALEDYDQAIQLDSRSHGAYFGRGLLRISKGETEKAIADFDQAIQINPNYAEAFYGRKLTLAL